MKIFGLSSEEIFLLERWRSITGQPVVFIPPEDPLADIVHLRRLWIAAGGTFPVRECDITFVRPSGGIAFDGPPMRKHVRPEMHGTITNYDG